ncbi:hypothetical protein ABZX30_37465 [Streptomyces sp. NPDC004542]|uniref:hypothetical protein n=1 Tax=Streptomyces sp. NPDC004542 TaxID=3154281 RepID=UPI0033A85106
MAGEVRRIRPGGPVPDAEEITAVWQTLPPHEARGPVKHLSARIAEILVSGDIARMRGGMPAEHQPGRTSSSLTVDEVAKQALADASNKNPRDAIRLRAALHEAKKILAEFRNDDWPFKEYAQMLARDPEWLNHEHIRKEVLHPSLWPAIRHADDFHWFRILLRENSELRKILPWAKTLFQRIRESKDDLAAGRFVLNPECLEAILRESNGRRELLELIEGKDPSVFNLMTLPELPHRMQGKVKLVTALAESPNKNIVTFDEEICSLITKRDDPDFAWKLAYETSLLWAIHENKESHALPENSDILPKLLKNKALRNALQLHCDQARLLLAVPQLLDAAMDNLEVVGILAEDEGREISQGRPRGDVIPRLVDVLREAPAFAGRIAGNTELLRQAVRNSAVAWLLSYDPTYFDRVADTDLLTALQTAQWPAAPKAADAVETGQTPVDTPLERARAANPHLAVVLRDPAMEAVLAQDAALAEVLANHPDLLLAAHEYRRLLQPDAAGLRSVLLQEDSPLLAPHFLRAALRHKILEIRFTSTTPHTVKQKFLAEMARSDPRVGEMMFANPAAGRIMTWVNVTPRVTSRFLDYWRLRPYDERPMSYDFAPAFLAAVRHEDPPDTERLTEVLFRDEASLIRIGHREPKAVNAIHGDAVTNVYDFPMVQAELTSQAVAALSPVHWHRLFHSRPLMMAMNQLAEKGLLGLLVSAPAALGEAIARPGFINALEDPHFLGVMHQVAEEKRAARKSKSRAWAKKLEDEVKKAGGEPTLSPEGVALTPADISMAGLWQLSAQRAEEWLRQTMTAADEQALEKLLEINRRVRTNDGLLKAARSSTGLGAGLFGNPELLPTLEARPQLVDRISDASGILALLVGYAGLAEATRMNDHLYEFLMEKHDAGSTMLNRRRFSHAMVFNPDMARLYVSDNAYHAVVDHGFEDLVFASQDIARTLTDNLPIAQLLFENVKWRAALEELLLTKTDDGIIVREENSAAVRAAVSSLAVAQAFAGEPDYLRHLSLPWLAEGISAHPNAFTEPSHVLRFLEFALEPGVAKVFEAHPYLVGSVLGSPDLLKTVMARPDVVAVLAAHPQLMPLLKRSPAVHTVLRTQPVLIQDLAAGPSSAGDALLRTLGVRGFAEAMGHRTAIGAELRKAPWLVEAVRRTHALVDQARNDGVLWRAARASRLLADTLTPQVVRRLVGRENLLKYLTDHPAVLTGWDVGQLGGVLASAELTRLLDQDIQVQGRPLVDVLFTTPALREHVLQPGFTGALRVLAADEQRFGQMLEEADGEELRHLLAVPAPVTTVPSAVATAVSGGGVPPAAGSGAGGGRAAARPKNKTAGARGRSVNSSVPVARPWWFDALAASPDIGELLLSPAGRDMATQLSSHPELLPLLLGTPTVAEDIAQEAENWEQYAFASFLRTEDAKLEKFEGELQSYFDRVGGVPDGEFYSRVRDAARSAWEGKRANEEAEREREAGERAERLAAFRVDDPDTWQLSGRIVYALHVREDHLTSPALVALQNLADGSSRPREQGKAFQAHKAQHIHIHGGSGGATFTYVLAPDGKVDVLVYAISTTRQENHYVWDGHGRGPTQGPLDIGLVYNHLSYRASLAILQERGAQSTGEQASGSSTSGGKKPRRNNKGKGKDNSSAAPGGSTAAGAAAAPVPPVKPDPDLERLASALTAYHTALLTSRQADLDAARTRLAALGLTLSRESDEAAQPSVTPGFREPSAATPGFPAGSMPADQERLPVSGGSVFLGADNR